MLESATNNLFLFFFFQDNTKYSCCIDAMATAKNIARVSNRVERGFWNRFLETFPLSSW